MPGRVSMVIACYNKAAYIGGMLKSVLAQRWDNLELILVNDGSTDDSAAVIAAALPALHERGYGVRLLEQDNAGVAAAVKRGLATAGGDYVCFPDADDILHPEYVSAMAARLEADADCMLVSCRLGCRNAPGAPLKLLESEDSHQDGLLLERVLLQRLPSTVATYMVRMSYLRRCGLPESMAVSPPVSQEPSLWTPLFFHGGRCELVDRILYEYESHAGQLGGDSMADPLQTIFSDYLALEQQAIDLLPTGPERKARFKAIAELGCAVLCDALMKQGSARYSALLNKSAEIAGRIFGPALALTAKDIGRGSFTAFARAAGDRILGLPQSRNPAFTGRPRSRVIAWGALGHYGQRLLPALSGTVLEPDLLWDAAARPDAAASHSQTISPPAPESLGPRDLVLCLPRLSQLHEQLRASCEKSGAALLSHSDLVGFLAARHFYRFEDPRCKLEG